jgi:hypothetical protein
VIPEYADSQAYGEDKKREAEMTNYALSKPSRTKEGLFSMFVHVAFK